MRHRSRLLALLLLGAALAGAVEGCRTRPGSPTVRQEPAWVRVTNQAWLDMTVYVVQGQQRIRLGVVNSNRTERLRIPNGLIFGPTTISFIVDPIGSDRRSQSFEITVSPGEEVDLLIPPNVR